VGSDANLPAGETRKKVVGVQSEKAILSLWRRAERYVFFFKLIMKTCIDTQPCICTCYDGRKNKKKLDVWDVFMLDPDFQIERPKRYYRQGLGLLQGERDDDSDDDNDHEGQLVRNVERQEHTVKVISTVRNKLAGALHIGSRRHAASESALREIDHDARQINEDVVSLSSDSSLTSLPSNAGGNMRIDPSTNVNPLEIADGDAGQVTIPQNEKEKKKQQKSTDVSKHTFYIENSQMRLKLFAKNEVRCWLFS
jgi:phospholipase D1/2